MRDNYPLDIIVAFVATAAALAVAVLLAQSLIAQLLPVLAH